MQNLLISKVPHLESDGKYYLSRQHALEHGNSVLCKKRYITENAYRIQTPTISFSLCPAVRSVDDGWKKEARGSGERGEG
jgi:hypothetical protein